MWTIWDYREEDGANPIAAWTRSLTKVHRARLRVRLAVIENDRENERPGGGIFPPGLIEGPIRGYGKLWKIRLQGGPSGANERLILCRGPQDGRRELTLLFGAREENRKWVPGDAPEIAMKRYQAVVANPRRRGRHERVS